MNLTPKLLIFVALLALMIATTPSSAAIRYVNASRPDDSGNGLSWAAAKKTLQAALADAGPGDEIWVAAGTYKPDLGPGITPGDRTATFQLLNGVALYGGFAGGETLLNQRNPSANVTILSGDLAGNDAPVPCPDPKFISICNAHGYLCIDNSCLLPAGNSENSYHVVTGSGTNSTAILDGFTITAGNANGTCCVNDHGAGLNIVSGSPTIIECTFRANAAGSGGAISVVSGSPTLARCTFVRNYAEGQGAGMYNAFNASPLISWSTFANNLAYDGGGMFNYESSGPWVFNCNFRYNLAVSNGGGMRNMNFSSPAVTNTIFVGNYSSYGGAMSNFWFSSPIIQNGTFSENLAEFYGGGMHNDSDCLPELYNCIFWRNSDTDGTVETSQITSVNGSDSVLIHGIVQGGWSGSGAGIILDADPLFVDADGPDDIPGTEDDDFRLSPGSPAIDAGINSGVSADLADLDGDANTVEPTPFDLDGNPRFVDDSATVDTGDGTPPIVDMGAYEYQAPSNVLFVNASAAGNDDGSSWENAYIHLQKALSAASDSGGQITEIWVADGTYTPDLGPGITPGDRTATFQLLNGVALYGGFAGGETLLNQRNPSANVTILSGDLAGNDSLVPCTQNLPDCDSFGNFGKVCVDGVCIIADNNAENSYHVVTGTGTNATAVLDGFTIAGGNANATCPNCFGAGLYNDPGSPTITNCTFTGNSANNGGSAVYNHQSSPTISNSMFRGNAALAGSGGAMFCGSLGSVTVADCLFFHNSASDTGGAIRISGHNAAISGCGFTGNRATSGGAIYLSLNSSTISDCSFDGNAATFGGAMNSFGNQFVPSGPVVIRTRFQNNAASHGGAMYNQEYSEPLLMNCAFLGNTAISGGAISNASFAMSDGTRFAVNCMFSGNTASNIGGAIRNGINTYPQFFNSTFSGNTAGSEGGGIHNADGAGASILNSILWGNSDSGGMGESAQIHGIGPPPTTVDYSIVQGGWSGAGSNNLSDDPLFVNAAGLDGIPGTFDDDLRLQPGSPAIDAGNTPALPPDTFDLDGDANTTEYIPFDLAGSIRIYDDPATVDTGVPGSPVVDMGAYEFFTDCNANGIPDECDISCAALSGACDIYPGCGGSGDCDWSGSGANGVPDECDIASCGTGVPDCDDCNLNGIPDACDIADMTSQDLDLNNIPDECVGYTGITGDCTTNDWSCPDNWELPGDIYPDNDVSTYSVTLDGADDVFLDVDVTIDTLRIIDAAKLSVTQTGTDGDLTIVQSGGLLIEGTLLINNSRLIDVTTGPVRIRNGGLYALESARALAPGEGDIVSAGLTIAAGGELLLTDNMRMTVNGDFVMTGAGACGYCDDETPPCDGNNRGGIIPPPKFDSADTSEADVFGNLVLDGPIRFYHNSSVPFDLGGAFINRSNTPRCFDMSGSALRLVYVFPVPPDQSFEVGGRDIGRTQSGFFTGGHTNFSIDSLEVDAGRSVTFRNLHASTASTNACAEAQYVRNLTLRAGASVTLHNARVYYQSLTQESGVTVQTIGCGALVEMAPCANHQECADGNVCTDDACGPTTGVCANVPIPQLSFGDADRSGIVEVGDILCALQAYAENFSVCPRERTDIIPCGKPDGLVEVGDILAFLAAYAGSPPCPDLCP